MNKGTNAGIFSGLFGFFIMGIVMFNVLPLNIGPFIVLPVFIFVGIIMFAMKLMRNISSGAIEDRYQRKKVCSNCSADIPITSTFCPNCGENQSEEVVCEYCGAHNGKDDLMCKECNGLLK